MNKNFFLLFALLIFFSLNFISAVPKNVAIVFDEGLEISTSPQVYLTQNEDYRINFFVQNKTDGAFLNNITAACRFYMADSSGEVLVTMNSHYLLDGYWSDLIGGGNFSNISIYNYGVACEEQQGVVGGSYVGYFEVTYTGKEISSPQSLLYLALFGIILFTFIIVLLGIDKLPKYNKTDEEGKIMSITLLKYLRPVLWFVEWILFIAILYISSNLAFAYLNEQLFANMLLVLFKVCFRFVSVIVIVWIIWIYVKMFQGDKGIKQLIERGIYPQGRT